MNKGNVALRQAWAIFLGFSCMVLAAVPSVPAQEAPVRGVVSPSGTATWADHVRFQAARPEYGRETPREIPFIPMVMESIAPGSQPPSVLPDAGDTPAANGDQTSPEAGVTPSDNADGSGPLIPVIAGFPALEDNNARIPPDTMGAVGPNHLMTMLNTEVRIQDRTGANLGTVSLATWWTNGTTLSGVPFDPRIIYDTLSGRWMAVVDANWDTTTSRIWFAVSATSDPTGAWTYYEFNQESPTINTLWHDFPDIGTNKNWVVLTNNMYTDGDEFSGLGVTALDKSTLGGAVAYTTLPQGEDNWGGYYGATLRPAVTFDPAEENLYMVDGNTQTVPSHGLLRLSMITGTPASPSWSFVPDSGGPYSGSGFFPSPESYDTNQIDAAQLGTTTLVNTNDARIQNAVFRNGRLWFTHSAGGPSGATIDRTLVCWYQVDPLLLNTTGAPTVQSGTLDPGAGGHYFFPSIAVNSSNDAALGFSESNAGIYVQAVATGRRSADAAGTMDPISVLKAGEDSYVKDFGYGRVRWGDYSATVVDPVDDTTFWTIQEYVETDVGEYQADDRWGTWWSHIGTAGSTGADCHYFMIPTKDGKVIPICL